ncbi:rarD protein [Desulfocapsa sulfexigens DSM 10523]|uniref:RarD protein n=1 Tax=Desulfocapsa sulfexigens (strain DSM 10523 / SB164P1) TaxID=1167006 RepID=M1PDZ5_DESSD|nr:EamA family transporter RarD [Desulfocapsa sulfexigens]AGF79807.1 rarD protein [Desulfocapsa sulfexigens DSM 10523]
MTSNNKGLFAALGAFTIWGLLPLYWKALSSAIPLEIICHRITWSTLVTLLLLVMWGKVGKLRTVLKNRKILLRFALTSLLLSTNWLLYIWAVNNNYIVESSLGYYINPLINVLLGVLFLRERLRVPQWVAVFFAFAGVCYLTFGYGQFPWIAIVLAVTFGFYGLLRKTASIPSLEGLCLETSLLFLPAFLFLLYLTIQGEFDFVKQSIDGKILLIGTGIVTTMPLLFFGYAAQKIQLSTLGVVQYLAPTLQLSIGLFVYNEPFPREQMIGFALVWCGLLIYATEGTLIHIRKTKRRL